MRKNGVLTYLHADHLGSTVLETNASGAVVNDEKYKAYGKQRDSGTVSTDHRFTGQKEDASGLQYFNARFYDPVIGMFVSPDTIVPQPGLASDYNRYLAFRGNPLKFVDPSGHDPLDAAWESEFEKNHGRKPNDQDRRDRLYSLLFPNLKGGQTWTNDDWNYYFEHRRSLWVGEEVWPTSGVAGVYSFAEHLGQLAMYYQEGEEWQFVMAMGLFWASMPYQDPLMSSIIMMNPDPRTNKKSGEYPYFREGELGWLPQLQGENQSHHYVALFYQGFFHGNLVGQTINHARDGTPLNYDSADLLLGDIAAYYGNALFFGRYKMGQLSEIVLNTLSLQPYLD